MVELAKKNFEDFYLSNEMLQALNKVDYHDPTPVQEASIPLVMAGIDLIVQAQTGTGKTAAFAIPIIEMLDPTPGRIDVLFLAPTRELAKQVSGEFERLGQFKNIDCATIYGGSSYEKQFDALETASIVVATPGRLLDLLNRGKLDLSKLEIFGLDEADEMLSMGFAEELDAIMKFLPEERQSLLFSATITSDVKALANTMLYYPEFITLSSDSVAAEEVEHAYYSVRGVGRARDLLRVLEYESPDNAIIFANTKADTFMVTTFLKRHGFRAEVLNGDLPQKQREKTLGALRKGEIDLLVATDVAARGIDITELSHVFNYTLPDNAEIYIHRTGRTGRAGLKGRAVSLISPAEVATLFNIRKYYKLSLKQRPLPTTEDILEVKEARAVDQWSEKLAAWGALPYAGKLGIAEQILEKTDGAEESKKRLRLIARLLALADEVEKSNGELSLEKAAPDVVVVPEAEEVVEVELPEEEEPEVETVSEEEEEQEETKERKSSRGRRRRRRQEEEAREAAPPKEREEKKPKEKREAKREETPERGRRSSRGARRRRGSEGEEEREKRKEKVEEPKVPSTREAAPKKEPTYPMSKMWVNMGKKEFDQTDDVVEMVCYMAGMDPEDIGKISVESTYSYVEVREDYFYDIINAINNQEWNGVTVTAEPARK